MVRGLCHAGIAGQGPTGCSILDFLLSKAANGLACIKHPKLRGLSVDQQTKHFPSWIKAVSVVSGLLHAGTVGRGPTGCSILDIFPELRSPSVDRRTVPLPPWVDGSSAVSSLRHARSAGHGPTGLSILDTPPHDFKRLARFGRPEPCNFTVD